MMAPLSTTQAQTLTLQHFGISGQVTELGGERTQNFLIRTVDGSGFTLKVSDPLESLDGVELESAALLHIESVAPEITAPRVVQALDGEWSIFFGVEDGRYLRLLTYIEGTPLSHVGAPTSTLRSAIGQAVANLDTVLAGFDHPYASKRDLIWDVKNLNRLRPHLALINVHRRPLAEAMLDRFEAVAGPKLAQLPAQAVHSDMNGQNILVDGERLAGFIDFGDLVHAPRLVDLAGVALLQMHGGENDLLDVADIVTAYNEITPLTDLEIELLPEFMIGRCVINVLVTEFLADRAPANRTYIMKNNPGSWKRLERLSILSQNPFRSPLQKRRHTP